MAYNDYEWTTRSGNIAPQGSDPYWSSFMNSYNIGGFGGTYRSYSWTIRFNNYGKQTFRTAVDDQGGLFIDGVLQFQMGGYGGETYLTTPGYFSPGEYTIKVESYNSGGGPWGVAADWTGYVLPPPPSVELYLKGFAADAESTQGEKVNVVWAATNPGFDINATLSTNPTVSGIGGTVSATGGTSSTNFPVGTTDVTFNAWTATSSNGNSITRSVTIYPKPVIDSFSISNSSPLSGDNITVSWETTGATSVSLTGSTGAFGGATVPSLSVDGSFTFTTGVGGSYTLKLQAFNELNYKVESDVLSFTVRDETPNAFEWVSSDENTPNQQKESNTISISGFGPTQFVDNKLPIKSNYPIQIMINGDGVWRDVEEI